MKIELIYEKLAAPAVRALRELRLSRLEDLSTHEKKSISELHGIGPSAMKVLEKEMDSLGLGFKESAEDASGGVSSVDEYIKKFPVPVRKKLRKIRSIIRSAAPDAMEKLAYHMPTFYLYGNLIYFAAYDNHIGIYGISGFHEGLDRYKSGRGTIKIPLDEPLPVNLIEKLVRYRAEENTRKALKADGG
jgi:uncharacterized protein YdhG (YjbR/CyaY superfamily)